MCGWLGRWAPRHGLMAPWPRIARMPPPHPPTLSPTRPPTHPPTLRFSAHLGQTYTIVVDSKSLTGVGGCPCTPPAPCDAKAMGGWHAHAFS